MRPWMERFKRWFFRRYKFTRQSVGCTVLVIIIFGLTLYFMNVMANVASYLSPDNTVVPKLTDRLFEAIPSIQLLWLTDLADALMFVPTVILVLTHYRPLYLLCKVLLTWALCNLMRITTVAITSFPDPRSGCMHSTGEFFTTFLLHRCGDCMFSGHTVIFVISALAWTSHGYHRFPHRYRWLAWICLAFVWALCIGSALIVIANRAHYTADVLVAFYIAGGNWFIWTYIFDHYIEEKGRLTDLTRPWGDGPDTRPHIQEREHRKQAADLEKNAMAAEQARETQMQPSVTEIPITTSTTNNAINAQPLNNGVNVASSVGNTNNRRSNKDVTLEGEATRVVQPPFMQEEETLGEALRDPRLLPGEPYNAVNT
ncbi:hypothetical protein BC939DRAFT_423718 [Gamsiella multidivaricata]|uniref:uncharacterized protein n=1 Tax=Gamsiella multidivaricata TaxID=101098 RepID=UPI00221FF419|nr:uncharacterized protein BC939DRAFT_423718 [Gamsiella multidivaricata]KAG0371265.1 sphingomyelin synthase [Gamsiella multidivaricata]KAI7823880.1 hypothetical protein BC939DRAFT_423718 [Gamsiella multidivaricata]